jgi:hypothetical protein
VDCAPRAHGQSSRAINGHRKDIILRHVLNEEEERPLGPTRQSIRQALVHFRTLLVRPSFDIPVELLEELEREVCNLKFAE